MFDTHAHLNFSRFKKNFNEVIESGKNSGITHIVIPGTDYETSKKAVEIAEKNEGIYAAVGIHPHHLYQMPNTRFARQLRGSPEATARRVKNQNQIEKETSNLIQTIESLLSYKKIVAIGEVGLDRHYYEKTKYPQYQIDDEFIELQKKFLEEQIKLAVKYKKTLILHNRETKKELLEILSSLYSILNSIPIVFHCCEPDEDLLKFAVEHKIYIGVDGDVTYDQNKQEFVKKIPLENLVLETDSPYLLPEPLRSQKLYLPAGRQVPNEPKNLKLIAEFIASIMNVPIEHLIEQTTENAKRLFNI